MRRKALKITAYGAMAILLAGLVVVGAFYVRLWQGPVSLNFMTGTIQTQINNSLSGMSVAIDGALIERAPGSGVPHFRLRNIILRDVNGNMIARAPRAAIGVQESSLFAGAIVPKSLELIGPRIFIKRTFAGGMELGFGAPAAASEETVVIASDPPGQAVTDGKGGQQVPGAADVTGVTGTSLIGVLAGGPGTATSMSSIDDIRITDASIQLFDEANDAVWNIPEAQLAFRRMPYGFAVVTNADIANGNQAGTWHAEISASYRRESKSFSISARLSDLVPANISDEIFALSQLARVKVPLSGQAEIEVTNDGVIIKASAEFTAAAGEVGLPDYLANPIIVDEGSLRADYDPVTGGVIIADSILLVGGSQAELTGKVLPLRDGEGRLTALSIDLKARNVSIDAQGTVTSPVAIDRVDFAGTAAIDEARLDIKDLLIMSGDAGVRLRGTISGGGESAGIQISGRVRDVSAPLLKRLWPPIMAPKTRNWINQNIRGGRITDGEFLVKLPVDALAKAQREHRLPNNSIELKFMMADVTTGYFKGLPPLQQAQGEASLLDNHFSLTVASAALTLPSGKPVKLALGTMDATDILGLESPAVFTFQASASAQGLLEYLDLPDLSLIKKVNIDSSKFGGNAELSVTLKLPLIKDAPRDRVSVTAVAKLTDASLRGALPKIDITGGRFGISVADGKIDASGSAKINGVAVKISWHREAGIDAVQSAIIEAMLDEEERKKIGINLDEFLTGPVGVKAVIDDLSAGGAIAIEADLSKAAMHIDAINWRRPALAKTQGKFNFYSKGEKGPRVEKLEIIGPDLLIKGEMGLSATGGLREAKLTDVRLSDENRFALKITNSGEGREVTISGDSFDAGPLIKSMFSPKSNERSGEDAHVVSTTPLLISANIDRVYAHRGEIITGIIAQIRTRGGRVEAAEISGTFVSGQPIVLHVVPANGGRELRIAGRDGGAALRAANLYSKAAGGQIEFYALLANDGSSSVRKGQLVLRNFEVRNEAALAQLDTKGKPKKSGPRRDGIVFSKLTLPFTADAAFVRIGESLIKGSELGASAQGLIRKADGAIDITGTIIPAYALNSAISEIPLVGDILTGGKGQGIIGLTFALSGNMENPRFQVNPVSAIAPGILRKFFEYGNNGAVPVPTGRNTDKSGG
ncbi:MAG TPA: AsmA-like C-terminal domain-containing protein [Aestuariivirga sp.]|nr:AsmA-like C-terminal domain-containing protein [Aestuariivirga sp.]